MTGIGDRIAELFRIKAGRVLDRLEDPREVLDFAHLQQLELLQQVRRGLADVATSHKRVELQEAALRTSERRLEEQAQQALAVGRADLARDLLTSRERVRGQLADLAEREPLLEAEEKRLAGVLRGLEEEVEEFRLRKETLKAEYTRTEAETRVAEAVSGVGRDLGVVGAAVQRANDRMEQLRARSAALDELMSSGALEDITSPAGPDEAQGELERITADREVEAELKRLRAGHPAVSASEGEGEDGESTDRRGAESGGESSV
ncbi:PspA/IM30 family protein [Kitasatospora sp. NPDC127059]|uniref:PspA/IM30 family protein n=1 Tax=unclassified Kitasatospora TaxID=2633591 RepID=UPI0036503C0E